MKVNFNKRLLVGVNMEDRALRRAAHIMGCQIGAFPIYLGFPLTRGVLRCLDWLLNIERHEARLAGWKV